MYTCICVYVYICIYSLKYTCTSDILQHMYMCMHVCMYVCMYIYIAMKPMPGHYKEKTFLLLMNDQFHGPYHGHKDIIIFHIPCVYTY